MKAYTDLEQSKKLAEILPLESADMFYDQYGITRIGKPKERYSDYHQLPAWSLAALLEYLSANFHMDIKYLDNYWEIDCHVQVTYDKEIVDACYDMILKLSEQKLL